jgi:hypothetical protein
MLEKLSVEEAKLIASIKTSLEPVSAILLTESSPGSEYRGRSLPIYQITTSSKDDINIYLDPLSGDVLAIRSNSWRMWDFLWSLHIMDYDQRDNINNFLLRLFSILALVSSISGILLFFFSKKK